MRPVDGSAKIARISSLLSTCGRGERGERRGSPPTGSKATTSSLRCGALSRSKRDEFNNLIVGNRSPHRSFQRHRKGGRIRSEKSGRCRKGFRRPACPLSRWSAPGCQPHRDRDEFSAGGNKGTDLPERCRGERRVRHDALTSAPPSKKSRKRSSPRSCSSFSSSSSSCATGGLRSSPSSPYRSRSWDVLRDVPLGFLDQRLTLLGIVSRHRHRRRRRHRDARKHLFKDGIGNEPRRSGAQGIGKYSSP